MGGKPTWKLLVKEPVERGLVSLTSPKLVVTNVQTKNSMGSLFSPSHSAGAFSHPDGFGLRL